MGVSSGPDSISVTLAGQDTVNEAGVSPETDPRLPANIFWLDDMDLEQVGRGPI